MFDLGAFGDVVYQYDDFNRLICVEQPNQTITEYEYDNHGTLVSITDPEALATQYIYDDLGRLVKIDSPDTGLTLFVYDEAGNQSGPQGRHWFYLSESSERTCISSISGSLISLVKKANDGRHLLQQTKLVG